MRMKKRSLSIAVVFILASSSAAFSQDAGPEAGKDQAPGISAHDMQKAFEKAIKDVEKEKAEKERLKVESVKANFRDEAQKWLAAAVEKEAAGLNDFVEQQWEWIQDFGPYVHYDYYLKDFEFIENTADIIRTDTLISPYRGYVSLIEKRYVERYHTPDISYIDNFLFTVTTPMKVNFEYRKDRFVFINIEKGKETIENIWPRRVKDKFKMK